eukprot:COSAG02_NODE_171_length_31397_cov_27.217554_5_plen_103_part_00
MPSGSLPDSWSEAPAHRRGRRCCSCWPPVSEQALSPACENWAQRQPPSAAAEGSAWALGSAQPLYRPTLLAVVGSPTGRRQRRSAAVLAAGSTRLGVVSREH